MNYRRRWTPLAPDLTAARKWRAAIFATWIEEGHAGACGAADEVDDALGDLDAADGEKAVERALRYLRARKAEHRRPADVVVYVTKRLFDQHPPPPPGAADMLEVKRRSREWDALFWRYALTQTPATAGKARAMMRDARYGKSFHARRDELPTQAEMAALVKIQRDGEAFKAWGRWTSRQAEIIWLDPKAFGRWPYMPSVHPPLTDAERIAEAKRDRKHEGQGAAA